MLTDEVSGRTLEVLTTQPAVQIYTGNWLMGCPATKSGNRTYLDYDGVAIECQGMPDAPNHANFPSQVLDKGEQYAQSIVFRLLKTISPRVKMEEEYKPVSHPNPTATCISDTPKPSPSTLEWHRNMGVSATFVWMTPTPRRKTRNM